METLDVEKEELSYFRKTSFNEISTVTLEV